MNKVDKTDLFSAVSFCGGGGGSSHDNNDSNGTYNPPSICYWFPGAAAENPFCWPSFKKTEGSVTTGNASSSKSK